MGGLSERKHCMGPNAIIFSLILDDGVQRSDGSRIVGLTEPENGGAPRGDASAPREIDQRRNAGAVINEAECCHRGSGETLLAGPGVILVDIVADRSRATTARELDERRNDLGIS